MPGAAEVGGARLGAKRPEHVAGRDETITREGTSIPAGRVRELVQEFDLDVEEAFTHAAAMLGLDPWARYDPRDDASPHVPVVRPRRRAPDRAVFVPWERREAGPPPLRGGGNGSRILPPHEGCRWAHLD